MNSPDTCNSEQHSDDTFQDKYPCQSWSATDPIHLADHCCEETTEEYRNADTEFGAFVPAGDIVADSRQGASFSKTKEPLSGISKGIYEGRGNLTRASIKPNQLKMKPIIVMQIPQRILLGVKKKIAR
jgi:hypothetical protein